MTKDIHRFLLVATIASTIAVSFAKGAVLNTSPFSHFVPISVSGYAGSAELANFPVLVTLADNSPSGFHYSDCAASGSDLRFADADGNLIPHEIDTWNTSGTSLEIGAHV